MTDDATQVTPSASETRKRLPARERRRRVLEAAAEVFGERGYDRATLRAIAERAATTTPIVYRHFGSKAELHREVVDEAGASLIATWAATDPGEAVEGAFLQATTPLFTWIENHRAAWCVLFVDRPDDAAARATLAAIRERADRAMEDVIARLPLRTPAGMTTEVFRSALAQQITGAGNALAAWWWEHPNVSAAAVVATNHALLWNGLSELVEDPGSSAAEAR